MLINTSVFQPDYRRSTSSTSAKKVGASLVDILR